MRALVATFFKELRELSRDKAGLAVLFLMPAALVLVVSLVQDNILRTTGGLGWGQGRLELLFVDEDGGRLGRSLEQGLGGHGSVSLLRELDGRPLDRESARQSVAQGRYQFAVVVPQGISENITKRAGEAARADLAGKNRPDGGQPGLVLLYDPAVQGALHQAVRSAMEQALMAVELTALSEAYRQIVNRLLNHPAGSEPPQADTPHRLLALEQEPAGMSGLTRLPTSTQQNVPAWSLFGMFFIVVPLSGALIRERQSRTMLRLMVSPAPLAAILTGKVLAFALVCLLQFALMLAMGAAVLPLLGVDRLTLAGSPIAAAALALCAALAASGFGILVGALARTRDQGALFGAVSVVIAAALGGVMVPVYVMSETMRAVSRASPLAWGLDGFLEIFVRGGSLVSVSSHMLLLLGFFLATATAAWLALSRERA
ncbi:ABC transporter permease [Desulfocurvibacter africanus]|uniref:ABC-2 type transporter n=1 Tax=Desulfocurvibacter africanus subsp. africanus str. Walvis Bay TaxID=690850 RepID=F3YYF2_DESAF|nr:ABC transporter permease [Desulfocurvibacter africanus]EGJ49596.1 ABC-2 type transporter [Desulfocurvibacter africanus subsp. africanus str. Walvis Bay]